MTRIQFIRNDDYYSAELLLKTKNIPKLQFEGLVTLDSKSLQRFLIKGSSYSVEVNYASRKVVLDSPAMILELPFVVAPDIVSTVHSFGATILTVDDFYLPVSPLSRHVSVVLISDQKYELMLGVSRDLITVSGSAFPAKDIFVTMKYEPEQFKQVLDAIQPELVIEKTYDYIIPHDYRVVLRVLANYNLKSEWLEGFAKELKRKRIDLRSSYYLGTNRRDETMHFLKVVVDEAPRVLKEHFRDVPVENILKLVDREVFRANTEYVETLLSVAGLLKDHQP